MKLVPVWRGGTEWFEFLLIIACSYVSLCFRVTRAINKKQVSAWRLGGANNGHLVRVALTRVPLPLLYLSVHGSALLFPISKGIQRSKSLFVLLESPPLERRVADLPGITGDVGLLEQQSIPFSLEAASVAGWAV